MEPTIIGGNRIEVRRGNLVVDEIGDAIAIGSTPRTVGRHRGCDLVISGDAQVSKVHAELTGTEHGIRVRDLGSRNGTFVGAHRVVEAFLTEDAVLRCGKTEIRLELGKKERIELLAEDAFGRLVGATARMRALFTKLRKVAPSNLTVLILGETGTGKEVVAEAIHKASKRAAKPFVVVDCTHIPASLAESALFGHERGSFTGATERRVSPFVEANGGTVFIDEVGELPKEIQSKLLRTLGEQRIKPVGSNEWLPVDVRVLAATRRELAKEVNEDTFRSDLYFRLRQEKVDLPPLRERLDDLPLLVRRIMRDMGAEQHYSRIPRESFQRLARYDWPGNVRELRDAVNRALQYDERTGPLDLQVIDDDDLRATRRGSAALGGTLREAVSKLEADYFTALNEELAGNISEIARRSGADRKTVREALRRLGLTTGRRA